MLQRLASLGAGLVLLALATSGCFTQQSDGVFGPANSLGGVENNSPALSLKASPARGPGPLEVEFSLSALERDGGALTWSLDFGDRTAPAAGSDLPAAPRHTYKAPGAYVATFKVGAASSQESFVSTISIVVLEGLVPGSTTQGPEEPPEYSPPPAGGGGGGGGGGSPPASQSQTSTGPGNATTSETGTSTDPAGNGTSSTSESSTSTTDEPTSSSSSTSGTGTSSSTGTQTFSDPGTSTSSSDTSTAPPPDPEPEPEPTGSESQSSTDPPL